MASHGQPLTRAAVDRLRALRLDHLRADVHLADPGFPAALARAHRECMALGCRLELALFLSDDAEAELARLASSLAADVPVARVLVFHEGGGAGKAVSTGPLVELARHRLREVLAGVPFAGGTNSYFTDLNRNRPDSAAMDAVAYSINPQVHAFDETSLVETLQAQAETIRAARAFCGDRPLIVSPITLRPRFNPNALAPEAAVPGELPAAVDPRQMSLFGAAWTVGSVKYLAEAGAAALTYYETTGWRGVMETEEDSPLPDHFPSSAGMAFPLYHVLADLAEWKPGDVVACASSDPLAVAALALHAASALHILVANLTAADHQVILAPLASGRVTLRRLNTDSALTALFKPDRFRSTLENADVTDRRLTLALSPYEVARVDLLS
jgi:hypothetical protein